MGAGHRHRLVEATDLQGDDTDSHNQQHGHVQQHAAQGGSVDVVAEDADHATINTLVFGGVRWGAELRDFGKLEGKKAFKLLFSFFDSTENGAQCT